MKKLLSAISILTTLTLIGCKDDETGSVTPGFDRQEMLANLADHMIIPSYDSLDRAVFALGGAVEGFIAAPDITKLTQTKMVFEKAYHTWQRAAFWEFGPAFDILLMSSANSFPADRANIDNNISSGSYDLNTISGQDEKGFPAIDYLLNGIADTDAGVVDMFTTDANAEHRKAYLLAVSDDIKTRVQGVVAGWSTSGDNYREAFIERDGTDVGSSIGLMVNELNKFFERETRDKKIGIPLGKRSQGIAIPANVEAGYSDISISLASENLEAIYDFYMGKGAEADGLSFYEYLEALNAQYNGGLLADAIKDQFKVAIKEVGEIPSPYDETVETNPAPAEEAYLELQKLVILLKADMPSALGVLVTYQDNDGD